MAETKQNVYNEHLKKQFPCPNGQATCLSVTRSHHRVAHSPPLTYQPLKISTIFMIFIIT